MDTFAPLKKALQDCAVEQVTADPWCGLEVPCYIHQIVDGDTIEIVFLFNDQLVRQRIRFARIDTPELRPKRSQFKTEELRQLEIKKAQAATAYVEEALKSKYAIVKLGKRGNFGRPLCEIYLDPEKTQCLNTMLLETGHAKPYA